MEFEMLSAYAKSVVEFLIDQFRYSEREAVNVVSGYVSVIERIGYFDNPKDWAFKIDEAMRYNITPDMWHNVL